MYEEAFWDLLAIDCILSRVSELLESFCLLSLASALLDSFCLPILDAGARILPTSSFHMVPERGLMIEQCCVGQGCSGNGGDRVSACTRLFERLLTVYLRVPPFDFLCHSAASAIG